MPRNWKQKTKNKRNNTRSMAIDAKALSDNNRSIEVSFSSEKAVQRWFGREILSHNVSAVDLTRLNEIGVLLFNHNRDVVIGKVDKAWIDDSDKKGRAIVTFDNDDESEKIYQKVKNETLRGVSVSYSVDAWEEVKAGATSIDGRFIGPCEIATRWIPTEISIVSVPADENVGIGRELENDEDEEEEEETKDTDAEENEKKKKKKKKKTDDEDEENEEEKRSMPKNLGQDVKRQLIKAERQRASEINALCRDFNLDSQEYIDSDSSIEEVRSQILTQLRADKKPVGGGRIEVTAAESDKFRAAAADSILMRSGLHIEKSAEGARDLRGLRLRDLAIESLRMSGITDASRYDNERLFREALTPGSNFSAILDNTVNKSMKTAYNAQVTTYKDWVSTGSNPDFKPTKKYQISEAGDLEVIPENGEFKHDEMKDEGVETSLLTYGKSFSISRQALINDDISIITKLPQSYVRAAGRGINKAVYQMLGKNPKIYDGINLFNDKHFNIAKVGGDINVENMGEARRAMRSQKNLRGKEVLNIAPKFLIVPASLETKAEQFLNSIADPSTNNANIINPFRNKLQLIVDPELDIYNENAWYLAANPADCDSIEVTYLNGSDVPQLESTIAFDSLGMKWRIFIDYGVTAIDYRGLYQNGGLSK